ncbi:MAG: aminotransferase class I/II-fold pyridoxal phosphate-dependent enzyme [Lachnospiraceae bacterium]|nr:aminotransferase class I/II-fold pyridoxal phosphate-dependent enzyme [Lachnospiraceae bacterium]
MPSLSDRSSGFTDSVIRRMTRIANRYDAINLSQGFPDFAPPIEITDKLREIAPIGPHQYPITWGAKNFRDALSKKCGRFMGRDIDPESEIVVTCGSTEAMICAMMSVVNPGEKVIVFSPFYENYGADAILSGATPIYVPLVPPSFGFDKQMLEDAFKQHPKALILCNPSNPSGKVFTYEELKFISELAIKYDTFVITDEVYEHIVYEPYKHIYINSFPGMFERTISCSSLSKTYSITGWRLGYMIAPANIIERAKKVHDFLTVGAAAPLMEAAVVGLEFPDSYYEELRAHYTHMRDLFLNGIKEFGLNYNEPQGAYFVLVDISEFGASDDLEFCEWMAANVGVAAVPGSSFFKEDINNYIRFHFAKKDETLKAALERLSGLKAKALSRNNLRL